MNLMLPSLFTEYPTCDEDQFQCPHIRECISQELECDGIFDCQDHADEDPEKCNRSPCLSHMYLCDNGICINETLVCNKLNDCGDSSDEFLCGGSWQNATVAKPADLENKTVNFRAKCYCKKLLANTDVWLVTYFEEAGSFAWCDTAHHPHAVMYSFFLYLCLLCLSRFQ